MKIKMAQNAMTKSHINAEIKCTYGDSWQKGREGQRNFPISMCFLQAIIWTRLIDRETINKRKGRKVIVPKRKGRENKD